MPKFLYTKVEKKEPGELLWMDWQQSQDKTRTRGRGDPARTGRPISRVSTTKATTGAARRTTVTRPKSK